jgi:hypothetical protein
VVHLHSGPRPSGYFTSPRRLTVFVMTARFALDALRVSLLPTVDASTIRHADARRYFGPAPARTAASTPDAASSVTVYGGVNTLPPFRSAVMPLVLV